MYSCNPNSFSAVLNHSDITAKRDIQRVLIAHAGYRVCSVAEGSIKIPVTRLFQLTIILPHYILSCRSTDALILLLPRVHYSAYVFRSGGKNKIIIACTDLIYCDTRKYYYICNKHSCRSQTVLSESKQFMDPETYEGRQCT